MLFEKRSRIMGSSPALWDMQTQYLEIKFFEY